MRLRCSSVGDVTRRAAEMQQQLGRAGGLARWRCIRPRARSPLRVDDDGAHWTLFGGRACEGVSGFTAMLMWR
jgi:hypothetical protein